MKFLANLLGRCGYVKEETVSSKINFGRTIGKRLDEHREEVLSISQESNYFDGGSWRAIHFATQDDLLMRLYYMVHGCWPDDKEEMQRTGEYVRPRPSILGPCGLPEYRH